jgi:hypothetical protein
MADTPDSKPGAEGRVGSTPTLGILRWLGSHKDNQLVGSIPTRKHGGVRGAQNAIDAGTSPGGLRSLISFFMVSSILTPAIWEVRARLLR